MRNYSKEFENRVAFVKQLISQSGAKGIVYGNSGGKDSALVGIICKAACENTLGVIMPCESKRNYGQDMQDAKAVADKFDIETVTVDLTSSKDSVLQAVTKACSITDMAKANIAPRLRMTTLYAIAATRGALVAGTGNKSEAYMGYFTKWGDGAYDFNVIADLTVTEIFEFLKFLKAPESIISKAPSAGLFEGQTDEKEMGVTYDAIDRHIAGEAISDEQLAVIEKAHKASEHKRKPQIVYTDNN